MSIRVRAVGSSQLAVKMKICSLCISHCPWLSTTAREESALEFSWRYNPALESLDSGDSCAWWDVSFLNCRLNKLSETDGAPELATCYNASFLALGCDRPPSKPARMAAVSPLAGSFCKPLEKFQYRPEMNTDSDQARPVTAHFIGCGNKDQFVMITLENS